MRKNYFEIDYVGINMNLFISFQASKNCTTIIVAHRLSTIREANQIIVLSDGKVVEQGTHNDLMARGKDYYNLVTAQVKTNETVEASSKGGTMAIMDNDDEDDIISSAGAKTVFNSLDT